MHVVTIAAQNYLPMAAVLADSYGRNNPSDVFYVLIVDARRGEVPSTDAYTVVTPEDLSLDPVEFDRMALIYDVTELSTALKPWALEYLIGLGADVASYLDPDIYVYSELSEIEKLSNEHGIVLTPHTVSPMRRDGLQPSEATIMAAGIYNLGFIAVNAQSVEMLSWWQERLLRDAINEPSQMLFTDQRWIDLVPGYFDHKILRDPGYNVAYWNLDAREVDCSDGSLTVNGSPLRFFHFSGFRPHEPWLLSKHPGTTPRMLLSEHDVARRLCDEYAAEVATRSEAMAAPPPYRYNYLPDRTEIQAPMRRHYRNALLEAERTNADSPPSVWLLEDPCAITRWFLRPGQPNKTLTTYQHEVWSSRLDLHRAYPDPYGADEVGLLLWMEGSGVSEGAIPSTFCPAPPVARSMPARVRGEIASRGVNLAGYFTTETGVGEIGRLLVDTVRESNIPYNTLTTTSSVSRQEARFQPRASHERYPITIASVNADQFPQWRQSVGTNLADDGYVIGVWAWEVEEFPASAAGALSLVDEIWAISNFTKQAIEGRTSKPVHVIPYPIPLPPEPAPLDRRSLGLPEGPYFLFAFDYLSIFERKNPLAVIDAFSSAFDDGEGPLLVIKTVSGDRHRDQRERLRRAASARADIFLIEDYLDRDVVRSLMSDATAYISLHRSEGYGLTLSESMAMGKPVIATAYSGNTDFMNDENSLLVPFRLVPVLPGCGPYPTSTRWADPDIPSAAAYLRWVIDNPQQAHELGIRARESVGLSATMDRAVNFVSDRVEAILGQAAAADADEPEYLTVSGALTDALTFVNTPPDVGTPSRHPRLAKKFRHAVYRTLAHHDQQVNERMTAIVQSVQSVEADVRAADLHQIHQIEQTSETVDRLRITLDTANHSIDRLERRINTMRATSISEGAHLVKAVDALQAERARVDDLARQLALASARVDSHDDQFGEVVERLNDSKLQLDRVVAELVATPFRSDADALVVRDSRGRAALGYADSASAGYADFEDVFRGSEDFVSGRLKSYVPLLDAHGPVLDIGCGRGEMLDLLRDGGVEARGVDLDDSMLKRCREKGHAVASGDGNDYLGAQPAGSLGAIVSFQLAEHLPPSEVRRMFDLAYRALEPGGLLIAETVNPHSPAALKTFWLDLTHVRPLFPESLLFLAKEIGFQRAEIYFPQGSGELDQDLRSCGEYAIIATKRD